MKPRLTVHNLRDTLRRHIHRQIRVLGHLVHIIHTREAPDLPTPRLRVHALPIRPLTMPKRRRDVNHEEIASSTPGTEHSLSRSLARPLVGRDRCCDDSCTCAGELCGDEGNALYIRMPVFRGETQL